MQTATNPQTGEKLVLQNGQWVPAGNAPPAPATPAAPQPMVVGTPRPEKPQVREVGGSLGIVDQNTGSFTPTYTPPPKPEERAKPTDGEKTAAFLATRVRGGILDIQNALKDNPGNEKPSPTAMVAGAFGDTARNFANSPGRRRIEAAQLDILDAALTLGTGAAYTKEQLAGYAQSYFPQLGDDEATIKDKQQRLLRVLEAAKVKAGNAAPMIDEAIAALGEAGGGDPLPTNPLGDTPVQKDEQGIFITTKDGNRIEYDPETKEWIPVVVGGSVGSPHQQAPSPFMTGVGDVVEGVGDVAGLISNPLNAGINAIAGTNLGTDLGASLRNAVGLGDESNSNPYAKAINQGGIAAITGTGAAAAARPFVGAAGGAVADSLMAEPVRQVAAGAGAGAGSEAGRQMNLGPVGEAALGLAGGATAYGGANALMRLAQPKTASPVMQAAQAENIPLRPADVGGRAVKNVDAAAVQSPFSANPVIKAAQNTQDGIQSAVSRNARSQGEVMPADEAGELVREAGKSFSAAQASRIGRVYDRAQERAQGVSIKPVGAVRVIDENIAKLSQLGETNAPLIRNLEKLKSDIEGGVKVAGMRDARTSLSQGVYDGKLRSTQEKALYKQVINALTNDIETGLRAAGRKDALNLFKIADKAWSERIDYIDTVLEPVIGGKKSGEQILDAVESMAKGKSGGVTRLTGLLRELPKEQAGHIRATIIDRLGQSTAGQQNAEGSAFSASTFLTRWNQMSPKGKAALFGNDELRKSLDRIAKVAEATKETGKAASHSNTPAGLLGNVGALAGLGAWTPKIAALIGTSQLVTGKVMASPRFAAWLAKVPANPAAMERHIGQLEQIAAREPIIANDIASIQQYLGASAQRAAASPENERPERREKIPGQN